MFQSVSSLSQEKVSASGPDSGNNEDVEYVYRQQAIPGNGEDKLAFFMISCPSI